MNHKKIQIVAAESICFHVIKISFSDGTEKEIDFLNWLMQNVHPLHDQFRDAVKFATFKIDEGMLIWGKNWEMIFPNHLLYERNLP